MAEIVCFPVRPHSSEQAARLHADLSLAHARGEELGSRAQEIQAGGERLYDLCGTLENVLGDLDYSLEQLGLGDRENGDALRKLLASLQALAATAQRFPPSS